MLGQLTKRRLSGRLLNVVLWGGALLLILWFIGLPLARRAGLLSETVTVPQLQDGQTPGSAARSEVKTYEIITNLPKDAIPAILDPQFVGAAEADAVGINQDFEQVIGLSINGDSRAYPINVLSAHEIVNDVVGGVPVAVTWCLLCFSGIVYAREINGREFTFGVSGKLVMNNLVMYDHQTDSLWAHIIGQAIKGEMAGTTLEIVPATQTDWATWKGLHPETQVLEKGTRYFYDGYTSYYLSGRAGVYGETNRDDRLETKELVVGVLFGGEAKAYALRGLAEQPVVNDTVGGTEVVVVFDPLSGTGWVYSRKVSEAQLRILIGSSQEVMEDRVLTFRAESGFAEQGAEAVLVDEETGTRWRAFTGEAIAGPLAGAQLRQVPSNYAFWFAWNDYHPDTLLYAGP